ncbi:Two-component transcriptional response regulator, LuxR family [hydrothermal vent metagenome]|uniref:Two-component transcriptional response regulator, LuxR family n=1 Tax=hydrothermal vent metagenome TaxID=652676 RepID=A0A3B0SB05_9ZZZZ
MTDTGQYTAVIADDHAIVRSGLKTALESDIPLDGFKITVVAEASTGLDAIAAVKQYRPQLLLLDVSMPMAGGVEVLIETRRWSPETRIIVFTGISALGKVSELVEVGVDGLFSKAEDSEGLFKQVPMILQGGRYISSYFTDILNEAPKQGALTGRERQILNLIVGGQSNKEISIHLGISAKTVDRHRTNLMQKLEVHSVAQLIAYSLREGLIDPAAEV